MSREPIQNRSRTRPNDPFVQINRSGSVRSISVLRDNNYYVLDQYPLSAIEAMDPRGKAERGFPIAWVDVGEGVRLWPAPDREYDVHVLWVDDYETLNRRVAHQRLSKEVGW